MRMQCDLTGDTSSAVQGGFAFEMIMTKLQFLENRFTEVEGQLVKKINDLSSRMENVMQKENHPCDVYDNAYTSCSEVPSSGIYSIQPDNIFEEPIRVLCDQDYESGGWIVFQHRFKGSMDFYRNWQEYKNGFGNLGGEFWLGLDRIHQLTVSSPHELVVLLEDLDGNKTFAKYDQFEIGDENEKYVLKIGDYSGTAVDSFSYYQGMKFSTFDADNDGSTGNCAETLNGAWWFAGCGYRFFNGPYDNDDDSVESFWFISGLLKTSKLMIRPKTA
ncbi:fibrinogen-like protein A [Anopheles funestus]|uniref:fibrinogen-like protein A n=1 Tax=Anopheles funestus TaxID=62324 RepID=UPI0020C65535|nr:fibrinogen-like protein A [Anopheles funestus]